MEKKWWVLLIHHHQINHQEQEQELDMLLSLAYPQDKQLRNSMEVDQRIDLMLRGEEYQLHLILIVLKKGMLDKLKGKGE